MEYSFTFAVREIIHGLITLAMYEFIFRPWIFKSSVEGTEKEEQGKRGTEAAESFQKTEE